MHAVACLFIFNRDILLLLSILQKKKITGMSYILKNERAGVIRRKKKERW